MTNTILRKRIIALIAMSYAMRVEDLQDAYEKLASIDKTLNLLETGQLQKILKEMQ